MTNGRRNHPNKRPYHQAREWTPLGMFKVWLGFVAFLVVALGIVSRIAGG